MNTEDLEAKIRAALQQNVQDITSASLSRPDLSPAPERHALGARGWIVPALIAAAVVAVAGLAVGLPAAHRNAEPSHMSSEATLSGSWRIIDASTSDGQPLPLSPKWVITLAVLNADTLRIDDGANVTTLTGHGTAGTLVASFRSTTFALDPRRGTDEGRALLDLLDSLAPSAHPQTPTRSSFEITGDVLTVHAAQGELVFRRTASAQGSPETSASATATPDDGAPTGLPSRPTGSSSS
jgi:hypothetical protein